MVNSKDFFEKVIAIIDEVAEAERETIYAAAKMMGDCMNENGVVQLFGMNHALEFAMELGYRAGGLMPFHKVDARDLALRGVISEAEFKDPSFINNVDMAQKLIDLYRIEKEDMYIIVSESGCEALTVETARLVKEQGKKIIAVISKKTAAATESKHPLKTKLEDYADLVLDTHAEVGDVVLDIDGTHKMNHVGTITGNVIAQMLTAETYRYLTENGHESPVLLSANLKGADVHNRRLSDKYAGRWNS